MKTGVKKRKCGNGEAGVCCQRVRCRCGPRENRNEGNVQRDEGRAGGGLAQAAEHVEQSPFAARDGVKLMRQEEAKQKQVDGVRHVWVRSKRSSVTG